MALDFEKKMSTNPTRLFVDMDGVLADFDTYYERIFGVRSNKLLGNVDWQAVRAHKDFFLQVPPMPGLSLLWSFIAPLNPVVLTGIPISVAEAAENKHAWVRKNLGEHVEVRCCLSKEKFVHAKPGDILIDDWEQYRHLWVGAGGRWITYFSAEQVISELKTMLHFRE